MPITMDITQTKLTHILHVSRDNKESHEYKLTNSPCKQLVVDDNDVLTLYAHDEAHYDLLCRALDHFYFQYSISHHQTPKVAEHPENFSLVFSKHNIRELLSYLLQGRYGIINQQDFQNIMVYLNEDPEHVNRQISSIKTWKSRRLQLNGFKTFTDADIRRIIRYVNARERHFKYVELNDNGITDAQALSLAVGFKHVYKLYLDGNAITDPAAAAIIHFDQYLTLSFRDNKMILNKDNLIYDNALLTRRCTNIRLKGTGVSKALIVNICEHCESLRYRNVYSYTELSIREDHSIKLEEKNASKKPEPADDSPKIIMYASTPAASMTAVAPPAPLTLEPVSAMPTPHAPTLVATPKSFINRLFASKSEQPARVAQQADIKRCTTP